MQVIADETEVAALIDRIAGELSALMRTDSEGTWAIIGIRARGDLIADRLAAKTDPDHTGVIDIALYRDDLSEAGKQPIVRTTEIDFGLDGVNIILVDDVLMTGRSVRAAIEALIAFGRPRCVKLAVLVDRGGRELPIAPDVVGLRVNTETDQQVEVRIAPVDPDDLDVLYETPNAGDTK